MFLDATKSYAQNILKLFLSYFIKFLVVASVIFFICSTIVSIGLLVISGDLDSDFIFWFYLYILGAGLFLAKNTDKIVNTLMSGSPSMGVGDLAAGIRNAAHTMHALGHTASRISHGAEKIAGRAVGGTMNGIATVQAMKGNIAEARQHAITEGLESGKFDRNEKGQFVTKEERNDAARRAGNKAALQTAGQLMSDNIRNSIHKKFTGQDKTFYNEDGTERSAFRGGNGGYGKKNNTRTMDDQKDSGQGYFSTGHNLADKTLESKKFEKVQNDNHLGNLGKGKTQRNA